jgi:hypothetical protein
MTSHIAALPPLHDELTSSHGIVHDTPNALSVVFVMVNTAETFVSPGKIKDRLRSAPQPT